MKKLAVLVPAWNEAHNAEAVTAGFLDLRKTMDPLGVDARLMIVDDGSTDDTFARFLDRMKSAGIPGRLIRFSRNFGKDSAIVAGLENCDADAYVVVDADGQTPISLIPCLVERFARGDVDIVCAVKEREPYALLRRFLTWGFFFLARKLGVRELRQGASDFMLFSRVVRDRLLSLQEKGLVVRHLIHWMGMREAVVPFMPKACDRTRFSLHALFLLGVKSIISFSNILRVNFLVAMGYWIFSFFYGAMIVYNKITGRIVVGLSTMTLLTLLSFGLMFFMIAIIGEYLIALFEEMKKRPRYWIDSREDVGKVD